MEEFNEMVSFALAHRDMEFKGKEIFRELIKEFGHLQEEPKEDQFYGVNLSEGLEAINITFYHEKDNFMVESRIKLNV